LGKKRGKRRRQGGGLLREEKGPVRVLEKKEKLWKGFKNLARGTQSRWEGTRRRSMWGLKTGPCGGGKKKRMFGNEAVYDHKKKKFWVARVQG